MFKSSETCFLIVGLLAAQVALGQVLQLSERAPEKLGDALTVDAVPQERPSGIQRLQLSERGNLLRTLGLGTSTSDFIIDRNDRNSVVAGYHQYFLLSEEYASVHGFTGDVENCIPGSISTELQEMSLRRVNYYRAQAGLPADIYFTAEKNLKAQKAAVIMAHLGDITHALAVDYPDAPCVLEDLTSGGDGVEAAAKSNLSLGTFGPRSIDRQMTDDGVNNAIVGHRRWILYSRAQEMGNGATPPNGEYPYLLPEHPAIDCLWVIGDFKAAPPAQAVPWPNEGYIPWNLAPNEGETYPRWSYSYPGADFSNASVAMRRGATQISLIQEPIVRNVGDSTIVWRPSGIPDSVPENDIVYTVTITGIAGAPSSEVSYDVILIDPYQLSSLPEVGGSTTPVYGFANEYSFTSVSQAEAYEARITEIVEGVWTEGAETDPTSPVVDDTDPSYALISSAYSAEGTRSFHLAAADFQNDSFTVERTIYPQSGSEVRFDYRRFYMHPDTKLYVEVSDDEGVSFTPIYTLSGQNSSASSLDWDAQFAPRNVAIPSSFWNKSIQLRFRISPEGSTYIGTSSVHGVYIDDISVSNSLELTDPSIISLPSDANSFSFSPDVDSQNYLLQVRPRVAGHWFGYGDALSVTSQMLSPPEINSAISVTGAQGEPFVYRITAANHPADFGASGLPVGAEVDTETGAITGNIAPGLYTATIHASNGAGADSAPLDIEILTGYEAAVKNSYPGLGAPLDDDDKDGIPNLVELSIAGMDPNVPDAQLVPKAALSAGHLFLSVSKSGVSGIDYTIQGADNLTTDFWDGDGITIVTNDADTLAVSYPISESLSYFLRLVIIQNSETTTSP